MLKCGFYILTIVFGVNALLLAWNMVERYRYFNDHRFLENVPNNDMLERVIDKNLTEKSRNSFELWMKLRRFLLNTGAEVSLSHQTGTVSKHAMRIAI